MKKNVQILLCSYLVIMIPFHLFGNERMELINLRTETSRTYQLANGSYRTVIAPSSVQMRDSNELGILLGPPVEDTTQIGESGSFYKGSRFGYDHVNFMLAGRYDTPSETRKYRAYVSYDVTAIGDWILIEEGLVVGVKDVTWSASIAHTVYNGTNTVSIRTGDMEDGSYYSFAYYPMENWNAIGSHTQITTHDNSMDSYLYIEKDSSGYDVLVREIESRRSLGADHPDKFPITFKKTDEDADTNFADIYPYELIVEWNYQSIPVEFLNYYASWNANLGGYLSLDDLQTSGLDYPSLPSGTTVDLAPENDHVVSTLDQFLPWGQTSLMHHHWNSDELETKLSHSFIPDPYNRNETAKFDQDITANIVSTEVPLQFRDPWFVDDQGEQSNKFWEVSGSVTVFKNQLPDPTNNPRTYYAVYSPQYVTGGGLYGPVSWTGTGAQVLEDPAHPGDLQYRMVVFTSDGASVSANYGLISADLNATVKGIVIFKYTGNVQSTATFTIRPGTQVLFDAGAKLQVYGTLDAQGEVGNRITFTSNKPSPAKGDWYGIKFQNSSVDADCIVKYADIEYATYGIYAYRANPRIEYNNVSYTTRGVYCRYASPKIFDNTISNSDYGIYLYSSSPDIKANLIEHNTRGIWANGSNYLLTIRDNKIEGDDVFGPSGTMIEGIYFYNCTEPYFYSNTITGCASHGLYMNYYSNPKSIGLGNPNWEGRNRVVIQGECDYLTTIYARDHSDPFLGSSLHYGGKNAIYMNVEEGQISAEVVAQSYSDIVAQDNWWGKAPPSGFNWDGTSSIDYSYWLTSDPGGGSSLGKTLAGTLASSTSDVLVAPPDSSSFEFLWAWGRHWWLARDMEKAGDIYKIVVRRFSHLPEAHIALVRVASSYRERKIPGLEEYLRGMLNRSIHDELKTAVMELLVSVYLRTERVERAIGMAENILARAPGTEHEYKALFNLFNIYHKDLEDDEKTAEVLAVLKQKYSDYELTQIAQFDVGEKVDWSVEKGFGPQQPPLAKAIVNPDDYRLGVNYPNPFNPMTTISYDLPDDARVSLAIYDILGREVIRLVDGQVSAGYHSVTWDAKDQSGKRVANGIYIYMIKANKFKASRKMVVVK